MRNKAEKFYLTLAITAFVLNWIWEMAQMFAFEMKPEESRLQVTLFCTLAAVIDAAVTVGIYEVLCRINLSNPVLFFLSAALFGALCAVFFEWFAFRFELWKYNSAMPIVPVIGVGLLPFVQLTVLVPLAIWVAQKLKSIKI